ncbi:glycosyltransferase family 39 protein [candidate division WOR-3 bacterium]|nr:glycosyltransferase family 39 protein [candidate division WOR-3 bacterium]
MRPGREFTKQSGAADAASRFVAKHGLVLILLLAALALALRASDLRADPPPDLSWSFGPYTDEALNTYSARNLLLYGQWRVDDLFPLVVYPLVNYLTVVVFKLFGMGFVQVKLLSLLAGVASVLAIYLLVKEDSGPLAGLLAGLVLATSFPLTMYSRLGLVESVQILFLLLAGLFYVRGLRQPWQMGVAGLFGASAILLVKVSAAFVAPAMLAALLWETLSRRKTPRPLHPSIPRTLYPCLWALAGIGLAVVLWLVAVYLPHRADYFQYVLRHSLESPAGHPQGLSAYLLNTFTVGLKSGLVARLSWVALLGFFALPVLAAGRSPGMRFLFCWFVSALLMLGYMNYRPDRYELVLLPPLLAAFAVVLARLIQGARDHRSIPRSLDTFAPLLQAVLYALWLWAACTQLAYYTNGFWGLVRPRGDTGLLAATLVIAAVVVAFGYSAARSRLRGLGVRSLALRAVVAVALLLLTLRLDFAQYFRWFGNRTHVLVQGGDDLDRSLPKDAVLTGNWAPALLLGSTRRAVPMTDWANSDDPVRRFGSTHLVSLENGFDYQLFSQRYPELMAQTQVFRRYEVRGISLLVYALPAGQGR